MDLRKLKVAGATIGGVFAALYLGFLLLPNLIDINKFMPTISSEVEKMSGFKLEAVNPKLQTTFKFGVKVKADSFNVNYKDNSPLVSLKKPEIEVNLPTILIGHINLDKIKADEVDAYLLFTKDKKYTVMEYVDNILKAAEPTETKDNKEEAETQSSFTFPIKIQNINVKAGKIALHLTDENVNKTYIAQLNNSVFLMKSLNGPVAFKTQGFVGIENSNKKFVNVDVNFRTKLPKFETTNNAETANNTETIELPELNINPFRTLEDFNFRTDVFAKLNIKNIEDFRAKGNVKIDKFSLKLAEIQLPESYVNLNFDERDINIDSKFFVSKDEFLETKSFVRTGKKSKLNLNLKTEKITLKSLFDIVGAILNICCVENDIKSMTANGYIKSKFNLDTDFKTIKSDGEVKLIDGDIRYAKAGLILSQIKAYLDFSDNALNIKDTSALVNGAKFDVSGEIASSSDVNLSIKSDPLKIKDLINIGTEFKLINKKDIADFEFNDGTLTVLVNVLGDFKNIQPKADIDLNDFKMLVKSAKMPISIDGVNIVARPKDVKGKSDIDASIKVKNVKASMQEPKLGFIMPNMDMVADMSKLTINPASATLEGTKINISGKVNNYMVNPETDIKISGNVHPNTVLAFIPKEFRDGIKYAGAMPYSAKVLGTLDNLKITGDLTTNPANYISIIEIPDAKNKNNVLNLDMTFKNDVLEINDINVKSVNDKLAAIKGQVKNIYNPEPTLAGLNISIPNKTNIVIPMLGGASFNAVGNITLSGRAFSPDITGSINVDTFKYPDFGLTLETLVLNFNKNVLNAKANNAKVANSDFSGDAAISTNFLKGVIINNLNYNSNYIDTDALIKLADDIMKTMPAPAPSSGGAGNSAPADLGVVINGGGAKIAKLKSGTLIIENITYNHTLLNNIYNLNNLVATFAQGTASGKCSYDVMTGKINVDMKADNIAMKDAAKAFIGLDLVKSGTLEGSAKVSLSGATLEEQMRTLNGTVTFSVKDGEYGETINFGRFINAANVLNLSNFASMMGNITSKVNSYNTQEFKNINGVLTFNKGTASVSSFKSQGNNMSLYANGTYNLLNNHANLKITGKVSSKVAGALGSFGTNKIQSTVEKVTAAASNAIDKAASALNEKYSENKAVQTGLAILGTIKNNATGGNTGNTEQKTAGQVVTSAIKEKINPIFGAIPTNDIANIPPLSTNETENTKNFQVTIIGLITNPASIKSFKFQNDGSTATE